jgi:hypothetical protein
MLWAFVALEAVALAFAGFVAFRSQQQVARAMELLASRSYGEFAAGQVKLKGKEKPPEPMDPGFA